jgi:hypothetical protein
MEQLARTIAAGGSSQSFGPWSRAELQAAAIEFAVSKDETDMLDTLEEFIRWLSARS